MKIIIIALFVSALAAFGINTWTIQSNVTACVHAPGCVLQDKQPVGTETNYKYGFPATYRSSVTFKPNNSDQSSKTYAGYAEATAVTQPTNILLGLMNIIFWFPLMYLASQFIVCRRVRSAKSVTHTA